MFEDEKYLRIVSGFTAVKYGGNSFLIEDPYLVDKQRALLYYNQMYDEYCKSGLSSQSENEVFLRDRKIWTIDQEIQIESLKKDLKKVKDDLSRLEFQSESKFLARKKEFDLELEIKKLQQYKQCLNNQTAEHFATVDYYKYLIWLNTYNLWHERIWKTWQEFELADAKLVESLIHTVFFSEDYNETLIRKIARTEPWRSTWLAGVKTGNLFRRPQSELTDLQKNLVIWSIMYDGVFEHPESPSQYIIENDELLDKWFEEQSEKRRNKSDIKINKKGGKNYNEIGIMVESEEDAKRVYNLNSPQAKRILESRAKHLVQAQESTESQLPDVKQRLQMERNKHEIQAVLKRGRASAV